MMNNDLPMDPLEARRSMPCCRPRRIVEIWTKLKRSSVRPRRSLTGPRREKPKNNERSQRPW